MAEQRDSILREIARVRDQQWGHAPTEAYDAVERVARMDKPADPPQATPRTRYLLLVAATALAALEADPSSWKGGGEYRELLNDVYHTPALADYEPSPPGFRHYRIDRDAGLALYRRLARAIDAIAASPSGETGDERLMAEGFRESAEQDRAFAESDWNHAADLPGPGAAAPPAGETGDGRQLREWELAGARRCPACRCVLTREDGDWFCPECGQGIAGGAVGRPGDWRSLERMGALLRARRTARGLSLREVGEEIRVPATTLSRAERGHPVNWTTAVCILDWLDVPAPTLASPAIPVGGDRLHELLAGVAHHLRNLPGTRESDDIRWAERLEQVACRLASSEAQEQT